MEPWSGCTCCLHQPSRSPSAPLGSLGRWHRKAHKLLDRPTMIAQSCRLGGSALYPLPTRRVVPLPLPPHTLVRPAEVVAASYQSHSRFQRARPMNPGASAPHQCSQPRSKGGLQPFDVSGVDDHFGVPLALHKPLTYRLLATYHHLADDLLQAPPRTMFYGLRHHHPLGQHKRTGSPALPVCSASLNRRRASLG